MKKTFIFALLFCLWIKPTAAQTNYTPFSETNPVVWGHGFGKNSSTRLPAELQSLVPSAVWTNGQASAGLQIRFRTNATSITINYRGLSAYTSNLWFSQFGANGVDLYARHPDGNWLWVFPVTKTVGSSYAYTNIIPADNQTYMVSGFEYCLYLPSYASIGSPTITVNDGALFEFIPVPNDKKPIVCYGTSICQGAASSRAGNIWTNIISRAFPKYPVMNLGFSGAGKMEETVIKNLLDQVDASVYILDCLPNLGASSDIVSLYTNAVNILKSSHPNVAIILTEHPGFADAEMYSTRKEAVEVMNSKLKTAYDNMIAAGVSNLYYLAIDELGLDISTHFADWIHPNDLGMYAYGKAYISLLELVFKDIEASAQTVAAAYENKIFFALKNGKKTIDLSEFFDKDKQITVYNMQGQLVQQEYLKAETKQITLKNVTSGYYIVKANNI